MRLALRIAEVLIAGAIAALFIVALTGCRGSHRRQRVQWSRHRVGAAEPL